MCQFGFLVERPDPINVMLWPLESHSGVHFDDTALSTTKDREREKSMSKCTDNKTLIEHG